MLTVVVVGAHGFLGHRLADALSNEEPVIRVGRLSCDQNAVQMDLRDDSALERLLSLAANQTVYYCANLGGRDAAAADPASAYRINAIVPARLAKVAQQLVYFSTDYVFSQPGPVTESSSPTPDNVYADSKAQGERGVLAASPESLVVRVSGLYDEYGTRTGSFSAMTQVTAPDDQFTAPTYVPDLLTVVRTWQIAGEQGVRHACGPDTLSQYEFQQLASLRWGFDVRPTLSARPRWRTVLKPSPDVVIRRPADVFTSGLGSSRRSQHSGPVVVLDCVGVVLSGRRWLEPNIQFWDDLESDPFGAIRTYGAEQVAEAYCPNPRFWRALRKHASNVALVLVNNGPWASFSRWHDKYGFKNLFDVVINSERDAVTKPESSFYTHIADYASGRAVRLVDDEPSIIAQASKWGWDSRRTTRVVAWPVEEYECERNDTLWTSTL